MLFDRNEIRITLSWVQSVAYMDSLVVGSLPLCMFSKDKISNLNNIWGTSTLWLWPVNWILAEEIQVPRHRSYSPPQGHGQRYLDHVTIAPKLLYCRKECDIATLLTPLVIHTLLYSRKWPRSPRKTFTNPPVCSWRCDSVATSTNLKTSLQFRFCFVRLSTLRPTPSNPGGPMCLLSATSSLTYPAWEIHQY